MNIMGEEGMGREEMGGKGNRVVEWGCERGIGEGGDATKGMIKSWSVINRSWGMAWTLGSDDVPS